MPTFFSLTPKEAAQYRLNLFSQIHDIVYHGNGGYDWMTVYNMPMWLRKFTFNKILKFNEDQQKASKPSDGIDMANPDRKNIPASSISPPSYVTSAGRKT